MTVKHDCSGKAYDVIGWHRCFRNATVRRDGKWYCWQHDPERVAADKEKRRAADRAKMDRYIARWKQRDRNAKLAMLVTPILASLLERLGTAWKIKLSDKAYALTLAARIREALEANDDN